MYKMHFEADFGIDRNIKDFLHFLKEKYVLIRNNKSEMK